MFQKVWRRKKKKLVLQVHGLGCTHPALDPIPFHLHNSLLFPVLSLCKHTLVFPLKEKILLITLFWLSSTTIFLPLTAKCLERVIYLCLRFLSSELVSSILCEFVKTFPRLLSLVFYKKIRAKRSKVFSILRKQVHKCVQTFLFPTKNVLFLTVLVW